MHLAVWLLGGVRSCATVQQAVLGLSSLQAATNRSSAYVTSIDARFDHLKLSRTSHKLYSNIAPSDYGQAEKIKCLIYHGYECFIGIMNPFRSKEGDLNLNAETRRQART